MIALTAGQISNFNQKNSVSFGKPLNCPTCKTLYVELENAPEKMETDENAHFEDFTIISTGGERTIAGKPHLRIESTESPDFSLIIKKSARGKNSGDIKKNLDLIQYNVNSRDSTLALGPCFTIGNQAKWRNQEVQITIKAPVGKLIHLGNNLNQMQFDFENINNIWNKEMTGKTWIMTPEGLSLKE